MWRLVGGYVRVSPQHCPPSARSPLHDCNLCLHLYSFHHMRSADTLNMANYTPKPKPKTHARGSMMLYLVKEIILGEMLMSAC